MTQKKIEGKFYPLTPEIARKIGEANLTPTEWKLWSYLIALNPFGDRYQELPPLGSVLAEVGISKASFYRAFARLQELDVVSDWITVNSINQIERQIRKCLHSQLGGLTKVTTPVGLIDLLTDTEIIEFKNIKDWKGTLGQILPYSAYYPSHRRQIHLFKENLDKLADIESACRTFKAIVTGKGA